MDARSPVRMITKAQQERMAVLYQGHGNQDREKEMESAYILELKSTKMSTVIVGMGKREEIKKNSKMWGFGNWMDHPLTEIMTEKGWGKNQEFYFG